MRLPGGCDKASLTGEVKVVHANNTKHTICSPLPTGRQTRWLMKGTDTFPTQDSGAGNGLCRAAGSSRSQPGGRTLSCLCSPSPADPDPDPAWGALGGQHWCVGQPPPLAASPCPPHTHPGEKGGGCFESLCSNERDNNDYPEVFANRTVVIGNH